MSHTKKIMALFLFFAMATAPIFAQETNKKEDKQEVSKAELTKFATVFQDLQAANRAAQQEMVKVVENEGLTMKRFNEIHVAFINENMESDATPEELKKHHAAMDKIQLMQADLQKKMDGIVEKNGLTTKKYQRIAESMREDKQLQKEYMKMVSAEADTSKKE
jgi:hypothetical protein